MIIKKCTTCKNKYSTEHFTTDRTKKDGYDSICKKCRNKIRTKRYNTNYLENARRKLSQYKLIDKKKNMYFDLDEEFVLYTIISECIYCGETENIGCDRIDNKKGHTKENCVPCCKECNTTRNNIYTFEEMLLIGKTRRYILKKRRQNLSSSTI